MSKAKCSVARKKRHNKVLAMSEGYRGGRKLYCAARETALRALAYAYRDRRRRKRDFRRLWTVRINAAARAQGLKYGQLVDGLQKRDVALNRKVLSQIAIFDPVAFEALTGFVLQKEASNAA